jgi:hypothetical protein
MPAPNEKPADPSEIKEKILSKSGTEVADIPLEDALVPGAAALGDDEEPEAGDDDPSRVIQSAEQGMTFNGRSNGGSANLTPFIKKRLGEIAKSMGLNKPADSNGADGSKS